MNAHKIAIAGDWHGNPGYAAMALRSAHNAGVRTVLHLGDFGVWESMAVFLNTVQHSLEQYDMELYFVDGNHEEFPFLYSHQLNDAGFRVLRERVFHIPRGHVFDIDGITFMGIGGAVSIDRRYRVFNKSWFVEEELTEDDVATAITNGTVRPVDVILSHDAPFGVDIPLDNGIHVPDHEFQLSNANRNLLSRIVDAVQPALLFHGHYHVNYRDYRHASQTHVIGLDRDTSYVHNNMVVSDTNRLLQDFTQ